MVEGFDVDSLSFDGDTCFFMQPSFCPPFPSSPPSHPSPARTHSRPHLYPLSAVVCGVSPVRGNVNVLRGHDGQQLVQEAWFVKKRDRFKNAMVSTLRMPWRVDVGFMNAIVSRCLSVCLEVAD